MPPRANTTLTVFLMVILSGSWRVPSGFAADTVILYDDSESQATRCADSAKAVKSVLEHLAPGSVTVLVINNQSFNQPKPLISPTLIPEGQGHFQSATKKARVVLSEKWDNVVPTLKCNAKATDLFEAIALSELYMNVASDKTHLLIFSDGIHQTNEIDFGNWDQIREEELERMGTAHRVPGLKAKKVSVCFLGVASAGHTSQTWAKLRKFWVKFFSDSGAELREDDFTLQYKCSLTPQ